jgi:hypothetical protein
VAEAPDRGLARLRLENEKARKDLADARRELREFITRGLETSAINKGLAGAMQSALQALLYTRRIRPAAALLERALRAAGETPRCTLVQGPQTGAPRGHRRRALPPGGNPVPGASPTKEPTR